MKKLFVALIVVAMTFSAGIATVEAKRMGGGGSFGKKSQSMNRQAAPAPSQAAKPAAAAAAPAAAGAAAAAKPSMWKGMLGGALLGLGLGALLSSMGLGAMAGMISNIIMIALFAFAAMFIYKLVRRKMAGGNSANAGMQPAFASAAPSSFTPEIASRIEQPMQRAAFDAAPVAAAGAGAGVAGVTAWGVPADFDTAGFLRHAKTYFLRLQAAWDKADSNDIREFTTPEMFAELRMQLQERGASENHTDVVTLDAELLGIDTVDSDYLASVRFTGMIKEDENAAAAPFAEIWNLSKPTAGQGGWILAGIEQEEKSS